MLPLLSSVACGSPEEAPVTTPVTAAPDPEPVATAAIAPAERRNHPPRIDALTLEPSALTYTDGVAVTADVIDPDGDLVDLDYEWFINGVTVIAVSGPRLPPGKLVKNDTVKVTVKASDGTDEVSKDSATLEVANTLPVFRTQPRDVTRIDGFQFRAEDGDGDPLTWRLEGAPPGMTINDRGIVRYVGSEDETGGDYRIQVVADDGDGWGKFEIPLHVNPGSKAVKAAEAAKKKAAEEAAAKNKKIQ